ncbi:hypothetical protein DY000_02033385 [Brassica cretica]|uniref:Secreted protein n=1 Tax=Brassica cretica TaxID=69181 RepID=A0ABQ7DMB9_BRACR|nr:hypothetical protein DY000_02033385 [Brassica cretica]
MYRLLKWVKMYGSGAYCRLALSAMVDFLARRSGSNNVDCSGPQCLAAKVSRRLRVPGLILRTLSGRDFHPRSSTHPWMVLVGYCGQLRSAMRIRDRSLNI